MNVYLVRHGEKVKQIGDPLLTIKGRIQSEKTGEELKDKNITKIFSSPYLRARETAEIISKILKVDVVVNRMLSERMNWGNLPGQKFEDFLHEWYSASGDRNYVPKGGISSYQSGENMRNLLNETMKINKNDDIVFVCHGGIIADYLRNVTTEEELRKFSEKYLEDSIKECSITTLQFKNNGFHLMEFASVKHLR